MRDGAGLAADSVHNGDKPHVYVVEPTGKFENDLYVTPLPLMPNPMRVYRSQFPLKIVGEVDFWEHKTMEELLAESRIKK